MIRIFLSVLVAAFLVCDAGAGTLQTKQAQVVAKKNAVSCSGSYSYATGVDYDFALNNNFLSSSFTTTEAITGANKVCVTLTQVGTAPDVQITYYLRADLAGAPDTLLATSTATLSAQSISASPTRTQYCLAIPATNLANTTRYHIVLNKAYTDSSNTVKWSHNDGGSPSEILYYGAANPPTTLSDSTIHGYMEVGCQ